MKDQNNSIVSRNIVSPIIFGEREEDTKVKQLMEYPMEYAHDSLANIPSVEFLSQRQLSKLNNISVNLAALEITNAILNVTFTNIASALSACSYKNLYEMIPVLPYIYEALDKNQSTYNIVADFLSDGHTTVGFENQDNITKILNYANNIVPMIVQGLLVSVCTAADYAIDEVIFNVRVTPNINNLYKELINTKLVKIPQDDPRFSYECNRILKNGFRYIIEQVTPLIETNVDKFIKGSSYTGYFLYNDYLELGDEFYNIPDNIPLPNKESVKSDDMITTVNLPPQCDECNSCNVNCDHDTSNCCRGCCKEPLAAFKLNGNDVKVKVPTGRKLNENEITDILNRASDDIRQIEQELVNKFNQ